ncbi:hypothetical protein ElyMa_001072800 [Elysia marginata]|uniref:Uncharacterized protein n=1 Tax=Elysia marginata TaxID=1093978 RepID=A0AAV4HTH9_9GAST|nr:hypothetical protein ElyMa_001072800 [Elysia marginata]
MPLVNLSPTRYATRWSDACRRNGHYISSSPPQADCVYAPDAALCRVRRRLQFGRKPPKDRRQASFSD